MCCRTFAREQDVKTHRKRMKHYDDKIKITTKTAVRDAKIVKRQKMQKKKPKVMWAGEEPVQNCWYFIYLGSKFAAGGGCMADVCRRVALAKARFSKMRHL